MPGFEPGDSFLMNLLIHDFLLAREILQRVIAVILVPQTALAEALRLVLHLLYYGGFFLRVLRKHSAVLSKTMAGAAVFAIDDVGFDDCRVGVAG